MSAPPRRALVLGVAALAAAALGQGCLPPSVRIVAPRSGAFVDDPFVAASVAIPRVGFDPLSGVVRLDGVDLMAALGLVPPFAGASGSVAIGSQTIAVSGFTYAVHATGPATIELEVAGLALGAHQLEAEAERTSGAAAVRTAGFEVVEPFTREAEVVAAAGQPRGLLSSPLGARLATSTLGEGVAGAPVPLGGGGALREGFVPVARRRAAGAP